MNRKTKVVKVFEKGQRGNSVKMGRKRTDSRQQTADILLSDIRHKLKTKYKKRFVSVLTCVSA